MRDETLDLIQIAAVGLLPLQYGLHMGILNAPMEYMGCNGVEGDAQDCIRGWSPALPSSIYACGGLIGSAVAGPMLNRYGLPKNLVLCAAIFVAGSLLVASSTTLVHIAVARLVTGIAAGGSLVVCPIYVNRLSPARLSGLLGMTTQVTTNTGIIIAQVLGIQLAETHWRRIMWYAFFISLVAAAGASFVARQGSKQVETNVEHSGAESGVPESERLPSATIWHFLSQPQYRYALVTTVSIFAVQQLSGINAIIQYGVRIMTDIMPDNAKLLNLLLSVINLAMTFVSACFIDRCGRKQLLLTSLGLMALCTAGLAFGLVRGLAGFSGLAAVATIASFAIGIGPIPFMYVSEFSPVEAVSAAQSMGTVSSWVSTFFVLALFPSLQAMLGPSVFYVFSACTLAACVWYYKWLAPDQQVY